MGSECCGSVHGMIWSLVTARIAVKWMPFAGSEKCSDRHIWPHVLRMAIGQSMSMWNKRSLIHSFNRSIVRSFVHTTELWGVCSPLGEWQYALEFLVLLAVVISDESDEQWERPFARSPDQNASNNVCHSSAYILHIAIRNTANVLTGLTKDLSLVIHSVVGSHIISSRRIVSLSCVRFYG